MDMLYILIENKVDKKSKNVNQCLNQFIAVKENEDFELETPIISLLITNDDDSFQSSFDSVLGVNDKSVWMKWIAQEVCEVTIFNLIQELLIKENKTEIPPIDIETKSILKNFNEFIWSEFYPAKTSKRRISINGIEVKDSIDVVVMGKKETLVRYENKMMRFLNNRGTVINEPVKPKLRWLNNNHNLKIQLETSTGRRKNTQMLGKEIIDALSKL